MTGMSLKLCVRSWGTQKVCVCARYHLTLLSGLLRTHATLFFNVLTAVQLVKCSFGCLLGADMCYIFSFLGITGYHRVSQFLDLGIQVQGQLMYER